MYTHRHRIHKPRVKRWWKMASRTSWYCVSCLSSQMKWMYPSCFSPPCCRLLSLVFCPTGHVYYPLMNDTGNPICAYYSHCTVSAIHPTSEPQGCVICFNRALLISAGPIIKALLERPFTGRLHSVSRYSAWFQWALQVQFEIMSNVLWG